MQLPQELQEAIEQLAEAAKFKALKAARTSVSADYRKGISSHNAFRDPAQLLSYLITRMPATFAACCQVFRALQARLGDFSPQSMVDLGAGPGTATWAALETFSSLRRLQLIERELEAIDIGKRLALQSEFFPWQTANWQRASLEAVFPLAPADLAVLSYVFAETADLSLVDQLLDSPLEVIAIIEPGTPQGFERIRLIRQHVLDKGAHLIAPCPHASACPMSGTDWCHFPARVERTRLHRMLKEGTLGHEDEKYSYLVFSKTKNPAHEIKGRIIRHPQKASGYVRLPLCSAQGELIQETVTRSNKERYRPARDAEWGSSWE